MKQIILATATLLTVTSAFAARPSMSGFATDSKIYVTVLTDTCKNTSAELKIDSSCADNRQTKNWVNTCKAELVLSSTAVSCDKPEMKPGVMEFDIKEANIATEAETLLIKSGSETLKVQLK